MYLPSFVKGEGGIFPNISLPRDYKNLILEFEKQNRIQIIEDFSRKVNEFASRQTIEKMMTEQFIKLKWDGGLLRHMGIGIHGGLDLEEGKYRAVYQTHNLGGLNGFYGAMVAINYIFELVKLRD